MPLVIGALKGSIGLAGRAHAWSRPIYAVGGLIMLVRRPHLPGRPGLRRRRRIGVQEPDAASAEPDRHAGP